jgi:hypothetical protein
VREGVGSRASGPSETGPGRKAGLNGGDVAKQRARAASERAGVTPVRAGQSRLGARGRSGWKGRWPGVWRGHGLSTSRAGEAATE